MASEYNFWSGTTAVWATAGNWSQGAPVTADQVIIPRDSTQAITGGDFTTGVTLASFTTEAGHSAALGSAAVPVQVVATIANILGSGATYLSGTLTTLNLANGSQVHIGYDNAGTAAAALTTVNMLSGTARIVNSAITTCTIGGGTLTYGDPGRGTVAITTLTIEGTGKVVYNSNATIVTLNGRRGTLDLSGDTRAVTITTLNAWPGLRIIDPQKRLSVTTLVPQAGLTMNFS
ncbi:MAG: hypothetical protein IMZ62_13055 [Chloroflexi bacterium]|nr:hypothetical protein [Chloroflexota bacterium]